MKRIHMIATKAIASGVIGILLFILISLFLIVFIPTNDDPRNAGEGWPLGFLLIAGAVCSIFLSGAIVMMLSYKDISSRLEIILIPVFSGLITAIIPLLIAVLLGLRSIGFVYIGIIILFVCLVISVLGGLLMYMVIKLIGKIRKKSV